MHDNWGPVQSWVLLPPEATRARRHDRPVDAAERIAQLTYACDELTAAMNRLPIGSVDWIAARARVYRTRYDLHQLADAHPEVRRDNRYHRPP